MSYMWNYLISLIQSIKKRKSLIRQVEFSWSEFASRSTLSLSTPFCQCWLVLRCNLSAAFWRIVDFLRSLEIIPFLPAFMRSRVRKNQQKVYFESKDFYISHPLIFQKVMIFSLYCMGSIRSIIEEQQHNSILHMRGRGGRRGRVRWWRCDH